MITICCNDGMILINDDCTLAQLLTMQAPPHPYFVVAVNREFVARRLYAVTRLNEHDCVDIITAMQGG